MLFGGWLLSCTLLSHGGSFGSCIYWLDFHTVTDRNAHAFDCDAVAGLQTRSDHEVAAVIEG